MTHKVAEKVDLGSGIVYTIHVHSDNFSGGFHGYLIHSGRYLGAIPTQPSVHGVLNEGRKLIMLHRGVDLIEYNGQRYSL